jgi:hypothetical protein
LCLVEDAIFFFYEEREKKTWEKKAYVNSLDIFFYVEIYLKYFSKKSATWGIPKLRILVIQTTNRVER